MTTTVLPDGLRTPLRDYYEYPNTMTLKTICTEIENRVEQGFTPLEAFTSVAGGVRNWAPGGLAAQRAEREGTPGSVTVAERYQQAADDIRKAFPG